jgi:hypothetical protein
MALSALQVMPSSLASRYGSYVPHPHPQHLPRSAAQYNTPQHAQQQQQPPRPPLPHPHSAPPAGAGGGAPAFVFPTSPQADLPALALGGLSGSLAPSTRSSTLSSTTTDGASTALADSAETLPARRSPSPSPASGSEEDSGRTTPRARRSASPAAAAAAAAVESDTNVGATSGNGGKASQRAPRPSGLSLLLARHDTPTSPSPAPNAPPYPTSASNPGPTPAPAPAHAPGAASSRDFLAPGARTRLSPIASVPGTPTPTAERREPAYGVPATARFSESPPECSPERTGNGGGSGGGGGAHAHADERAPLLGLPRPVGAHGGHAAEASKARARARRAIGAAVAAVGEVFGRKNVEYVARTGVQSLPAVLLGGLLNVLDGISCELVVFSCWEEADGVECRWDDHLPCGGRVCGPWPRAGGRVDVLRLVRSSFFPRSFTVVNEGVRAIISQLVYSAGGSGFKGGNGSMMIEVVVRAFRACFRR